MNTYPVNAPPKSEWSDNGNRFWYEEHPQMIVHYYKTVPDKKNAVAHPISVFVNMALRPTQDDIKACIQRALLAANIKAEVVNLYLNNFNGNTDAFWYADLVVTP